MPGVEQIFLLRHGTAEEKDPKPLSETGISEATFTANALLAHLELQGEFLPKYATGEPIAVKLFHSGKERAAQTSSIVAEKLTGAKCETSEQVAADELAPDADVSLAAKMVEGASTPLVVLVGHLPLLHKLAGALGVETTSEDNFCPAGGLLLRATDDDKWGLAHVVLPNVNWWMRGVSVHVRADADDD